MPCKHIVLSLIPQYPQKNCFLHTLYKIDEVQKQNKTSLQDTTGKYVAVRMKLTKVGGSDKNL